MHHSRRLEWFPAPSTCEQCLADLDPHPPPVSSASQTLTRTPQGRRHPALQRLASRAAVSERAEAAAAYSPEWTEEVWSRFLASL